LSAGHGSGVKAGIFGIWLCPAECVTDGLRILRGEQHSHHLAAILIVLKNFLTDQLTLAVTIGYKPNSFGSALRLANGLELSGLVATLCRASTVKTFRP
jgi:hypothetical protein